MRSEGSEKHLGGLGRAGWPRWKRWSLGACLGLLVAACGGSGGGAKGPSGPEDTRSSEGPGKTKKPDADPLRSRPDLPPERRALLVTGTADAPEERWIDAQAAEDAGYTLVDLSDDWTPAIFGRHLGPHGEPKHNRYRRIFIGLANDELDSDGEALAEGEKNYLELYGIFPSLSVLRERFLHDAESPCQTEEAQDALAAVESVAYVPPKAIRRRARKLAALRRELEQARKKRRLATIDDLSGVTALADKLKEVQKADADARALAAVEKRLVCEGLLKPDSDHKKGVYDDPIRLAVRAFQQKLMIYEANYLRKKTIAAMGRPLLDNDYDSFVRALQERVASAAAIIEDGSAPKGDNLVEQYAEKALEQLKLPDAQAVLAFFKRHPSDDFERLQAAIKLPPRPDYHKDHMELSIVVDRGDVWYDLPFNSKGNFSFRSRRKYPSLTLYTEVDGKKRALARWRTTIGGWRAEQAENGYEYLKYKMSDVGPRVIRHIIAGPVWIAPASTPIRALVKPKVVNRKWMRVVNYDELGPGYLSAYGLVAGYFVIPGKDGRPDVDRGIRAHGSSNYLSIYSNRGYSHGCHRLPNHLAIRLYSFILRHRYLRVEGDQPMDFSRQFLRKETVYEMRVPSRGFLYELDPPVPVNVLEGNIRGSQKTPIKGYVPEPWTEYPPEVLPPSESDSPESMAGGGGAGDEAGGEE